MGHIFAYSLSSGLILLALYIAYKWLLSAENQPRFNRITLLSIYAFALAAPLIPFIPWQSTTHGGTNIGLAEIGRAAISTIPDKSRIPGIYSLLLWIYATGMALALMKTLLTIRNLHALIHNGVHEQRDGYVIVHTCRRDIAPFSWGCYVVIPDGEETSSAIMIETHERAHIHARHFIDLIVSQLACIIMWYNPASWLMQSELKAVHEYEADENVLKSGCDARDYQLLLIRKAVGQRFPSLANSLNHSKLKKRMTMMYSKKTSATRRTRVLALIPAAAVGLVMLNLPAVGGTVATVSNAEMGIRPSTDAKVTTISTDAQTSSEEEVVAIAEKLPQFKGGQAAMMEYLMTNIKYPENAYNAKIEGRVVVRFTITTTGAVKDAEIVRSVSPDLDAEAIRVINGMSGMWTPGENDGHAVAVQYVLPVSFKLK